MNRPVIAVVDHGAGNLVSIGRALERSGAEVRIATSGGDLHGSDGIVLPGVGATATVMDGIRAGGFETVLQEWTRPLLGICVGMQVLFETSTEDEAECLGLLRGASHQLVDAPTLPHIGWNEIDTVADPLFDGLGDRPEVYFVHSYAPVPVSEDVVIARSSHGGSFVAAVRRGNVAGTQFHPERSGSAGLTILGNFVVSTVGART
ncbi:MAG: imidazole glycerol phosphate synthase subunit HisH [Acidimicrobiia bacterium]